jgi:hypothetical protein
VRDHQHALAASELPDVGEDLGLRRRVEVGRRLVQDQHRCVLEEGAGDGHALALAAAQLEAVVPDQRVQPVRERAEERAQPCPVARTSDARVVGTTVGHEQVVAERAVEQVHLLRHDPDARADLLAPEPPNVDTVEQDGARSRVDEAQQEADDRRLSRAARTRETQPLALPQRQADVVQHERRAIVVPEPDVSELNVRMRGDPERVHRLEDRCRGVGDLERPDRGSPTELYLAERVAERLHRLEGRERHQRE